MWLQVRIVAADHVDVYHVINRNEHTKQDTYRLACSFTGLSRIFIPQPSKRLRGVNILLEKRQADGTLLYTFIDSSIRQFSTNVPITEFYAINNASWGVYAHAFDKRDRCYLLSENVLLNSVPNHHLDDPSQYWIDKSTRFTMLVGFGKREREFGVIVDSNYDAEQFLEYQVEDSLNKMRERRSEEIARSYGITKVFDEEDGGYTTTFPDNVGEQYRSSLDCLEEELDQFDISALPKEEIFLPSLDQPKARSKNKPEDKRIFRLATLEDWKAYQTMLRNRFGCSPVPSTTVLRFTKPAIVK